MANCQSLFGEFHEKIRIGGKKKERMMDSKDALRKRIRSWFKEHHPDYVPKFYIQGSYKMKSAIRTKDDICDLDDGVYFFREPDVSASTLQAWIWEAVNGYTNKTPEHRKKCVRSIFSNDYEIDHPVYYKPENGDYMIAVKNSDFEPSDPKAVVDWFAKQKDKDEKLIRAVMGLKVWCDNIRNKMPSGLAMTILAANAKKNIVLNDRDDITLKDLLKEIRNALKTSFSCKVPAVPNDDLFVSYDDTRKNNFLNALDEFIEDSEKALKEDNEMKASKLWIKHLGDRFPLGENKDSVATPRAAAAASGSITSNPWGYV